MVTTLDCKMLNLVVDLVVTPLRLSHISEFFGGRKSAGRMPTLLQLDKSRLGRGQSGGQNARPTPGSTIPATTIEDNESGIDCM
jgi:hypothetical protein